MLRGALLTLAVASLPALVQAQRSGFASSVHAGAGPIHSNIAGHSQPGKMDSQVFVRGGEIEKIRHHREGFGRGFFPYFLADYGTGWPEAGNAQEETRDSPLVRVRDDSRDQEPVRPLPAQLIEIPGATKDAAPKPLPPTIFVLTDGEQFETQRYLLTANSLSATVQRRQRTIPLELVDLDATLAANRDRGLDL